MRCAVLVVLVTMVCVSCGGGKGAGATPKESFEAVKSAMMGQDWGALFELLPPSLREKGEKQLKERPEDVAGDFKLDPEAVKSMSLKEVFVAGMANMYEEEKEYFDMIAGAEYVSEEIDDTRARVKVKMGDKQDDVSFMNEDGKWYYVLDI